ncbi:MAG TPA: hypothetical protein VEV83_07215, partial [Parafilimonas sp.]|nr:hypothetical protein [Parafilimonas sp.]
MRNTILPKRILSFTLPCLLTTVLLGQPPKQWDKRFGGTDFEYFSALQQTKDGGYILGGFSYSGIGGDKTEESRGSNDYWVVKVDANGEKQWDKRFGGTDEDYLGSVEQTTDGGYVLGGWSHSGIGGDKTEASWGSYDYWVVKIDANGVKQWDKRFGGTGTDKLASLEQTTDGGYILGGLSHSGIGGDKTEEHRGDYDYWVVKIDANGVKQWDKTFGGALDDELHSLQQTTDGGYVLIGYSNSGIAGDKSEESRGSYDYWAVKIDANGVKQWDKTFGGTSFENATSLQQTTDGGFILGGYSESGIGGDKTEDSRGYYDYWVVKIDANGLKQWDKRFGGTDYDECESVQQTVDGGYILGGYSASGIGGDKTENSRGYTDYWVVKINAIGIKQWDKRFGGTYYDNATSLQQTTDGGYVLGGWSQSGIGGDKTEESRGSDDYWIVKVGCPPNSTVIPSGTLDICQTDSIVLHAYSADGCKYQWIRDSKIILGATDSTYAATRPGIYRVLVYTRKLCADISKPIKIISSCNRSNDISIYPNPSNGIVTLTYNSIHAGTVQLNVYDKTGRLMFSQKETAIEGSNT